MPNGWVQKKGKCYNFFKTYQSWIDSQKFCSTMKSHLLVIQDKAELVRAHLPWKRKKKALLKLREELLCAQWCLTICDPMDYSPPGSSVHGCPRQEYWNGLPFPSPGKSSQPRDQTWVSCITGRFFTDWTTREAQRGAHQRRYSYLTIFLVSWIGQMEAP